MFRFSKLLLLCLVWLTASFSQLPVAAADDQPYVPTVRDYKVLSKAEQYLQNVAAKGNKELLISIISRCLSLLENLESSQSKFILYEISKLAEAAFGQAVAVAEGSTTLTSPSVPSSIPHSRQKLYQDYSHLLTNPDPLLKQCMTYYDEIDALAQELDFPTPLIIATWFKEHTCYLDNPKNGRGNFQITSAYYEPGEITIQALLQQVREFITFSRNKRKWYDKIQKFDDIPVTLTYDEIDLLSIQKHAILYNGLYEGRTPQNSTYANAYFGTGGNGRDGIVATVLKVIGEKMEE